jgi:hypothetical protein
MPCQPDRSLGGKVQMCLCVSLVTLQVRQLFLFHPEIEAKCSVYEGELGGFNHLPCTAV